MKPSFLAIPAIFLIAGTASAPLEVATLHPPPDDLAKNVGVEPSLEKLAAKIPARARMADVVAPILPERLANGTSPRTLAEKAGVRAGGMPDADAIVVTVFR